MRILNLEGRYFVSLWRRQGHEVLTLGRSAADDVVLDRVLSPGKLYDLLDNRGFQPDLVFWADSGKTPAVVGFERLPVPCIGFSIDQYCHPWHVAFSAGFDSFLVAQKDYLSLFRNPALQRKTEWFPLFCDPAKDRDTGSERDVPVSFVGTLDGRFNPLRKAFLQEFKQHHPLVLRQGAYVEIFNRSRIVLNQSAVGELNFRLFQAAACGAAVLNEETTNGLDQLFTPGQDILVYPRGDAGAAARRCAEVLQDPKRLAAIAASGKRNVLKNHTTRSRGEVILERVQEAMGDGRVRFRLQHHRLIQSTMAKAFLFLATDTELPLPHTVRQFYLDLGRSYAANGTH